MLHYILQVVAFQILFLIIYDAFLRKETFFNLNRIYLLGTAILSIVIPFIKIERIKEVVAKDFNIRIPEVIIGNPLESIGTIDPQIAMQAGINLEPEPSSIWMIIVISGMCIATLILLIKITKLFWLAHQHPKQWLGNLLIIKLINSTKAFSFFHYIFLGEKLNGQEKSTILEHEIIHVKQKHTLDLLFFEVLRVVFWFNPLVYMYQYRMATLHEYVADAKALEHSNKAAYYDNLLAQVFETEQFSFVNPFFKQSLIKKRILMLSKSKSRPLNLSKYLLILPLISGMLVYSSCSVFKNKQDVTVARTEVKEVKQVESGEIPFATVEEAPTFTICESLKTNEERKQCMSENISKHVAKNFNTDLASELGLVGRQRINVMFKIDKDGVVTGAKARAPHPKLEEEAVRVINTLPQFIPGKHKGVSVMVPYSLPIVFQVQGKVSDDKPADSADNNRIQKIKEQSKNIDEVPFSALDKAPSIDACKGLTSEKESKTCFSMFISKYVNEKFNVNLASKLGLVGRQRLNVIFKVDKDGKVTGARARGPHPELEVEALRVINSLPQFTPGQMNGKAVTVNYSLPILFQIEPANKDKKN
ncbi:Signal transducer regulating beta-lactamase production, contains metallopeptidase domain [Formosa sp. Hel1_31_208]|uniref:M56 family metallopeptidase n=1 Tax=Formosa sp. Hel1_31_208 TaxID=1798225 RepID=UPI00087AA75D|nr:M56 family metallopeptidase [Formosa sp. Hel1_31_208]SDR85458.1 Signal transducer regulating beta-lactamase production, contains metallopeptidase domain [Formosa sp. Hel1_31_208]